MKILLFSDIHIHPYRPYSYEVNGMNTRLWFTLEALKYILSFAHSSGIEVWFLGDLFEDRKTLRMEAAIQTKTIIDYFTDKGVVLYAIPGNHDYFSKTGHVWPLFLKPDRIFDKPSWRIIGGKTVAFHPYPMEGYDKFKEFLANTEADYLFTHADLDVEKAGLDEHEIKVGATSIELYKKFTHVYSGHYHWRQTRDNFTYLGNPLQKDFGDYGQEKGFHVLDLLSGDDAFIPLPEVFPKFERFEVHESSDWSRVVEHRARRPQDYLKITYDASLGIPAGLDITTEPAPALEKLRVRQITKTTRIENPEALATDPVKAFIGWKKKNGILVPNGAYTFANEILSEVKK